MCLLELGPWPRTSPRLRALQRRAGLRVSPLLRLLPFPHPRPAASAATRPVAAPSGAGRRSPREGSTGKVPAPGDRGTRLQPRQSPPIEADQDDEGDSSGCRWRMSRQCGVDGTRDISCCSFNYSKPLRLTTAPRNIPKRPPLALRYRYLLRRLMY